jgi:hypothetical protein
LTPEIKTQLLANLPKASAITVSVIGTTNYDQTVGRQFYDFLIANGYQATIETIGMAIPMPDGPLSWNPNARTLIVAPSVR